MARTIKPVEVPQAQMCGKDNYEFVLTPEQQTALAELFGENSERVCAWEVAEMLDKLIDNACFICADGKNPDVRAVLIGEKW